MAGVEDEKQVVELKDAHGIKFNPEIHCEKDGQPVYTGKGLFRKKPGRPSHARLKRQLSQKVGDAEKIREFKARIYNSPKSQNVLDTIFEAALKDGHPNQSAAWKLLVDRLLPMSHFEKPKDGSATPRININISGVEKTTIEGEIEEGEIVG